MPGSMLVGCWWALWLGWVILDRIIVRIWRDGELTVESLRTVAIETVAAALMGGAAVLIIAIIRRINDWQHQAAETRLIATG